MTFRRPRGTVGALTALLLLAAPAVAAAVCGPSAVSTDAPMALVLSGGGAKGAYEAGAASVFVERGLPIRLVAGSSAGALNAAMIASGRADRLEALWRTVRREQVYSLRAPVFFAGFLPGWLTLLVLNETSSLFDPAPLRELIATSVDFERLRASPVRLLVTATDLARGEKRLFDNRGVTVDTLMAASAVPGLFPPVEIDGRLLMDGGLTGRAPVLEALEADPTLGRAVVVMSYTQSEQNPEPTTLRLALEASFELIMVHQIRRDTELARLRYPNVDVQLLTPSAPLLMRPLDFDPDAMARLLALGRADALACLDAWQRK
ncbi:MAG TPA: patatin-like phospholipase family protein [Methylomirabilota bacterium]|nr:patatin-like phospholipase family protein [Methylomirabilota bacterium]